VTGPQVAQSPDGHIYQDISEERVNTSIAQVQASHIIANF